MAGPRPRNTDDGDDDKDRLIRGAVGVACAGALVGGLFYRYRVCRPNEFLVKTGLGIADMYVGRKTFQLPFQRVTTLNMNPKTYSFNLHNMSKEKVEFSLPVVFTISPCHPHDDEASFRRYATLLNTMTDDEIRATIEGIIEGETRTLTASMTVEEMFSDKQRFRNDVIKKLEKGELADLGVRVINANIREMKDYDAHNKYFEYRKQRAIQTANFEAQVDVAEAEMKGETGKAERDATKRRNVAKFDQEAKKAENDRLIEVAQSGAELAEAEADAARRKELADVDARMAARQRETELQIAVEQTRGEERLAAERADVSSKKVVEAEMLERMADAHRYEKERAAEGTRLTYDAQAAGVRAVYDACDKNPALTQFYLGLTAGLYQDLAKESANAIRGLNPTMNVWTTTAAGGTAGPGDAGSDILANIKQLQGLGPVLDAFHKSGIEMPTWLPHKAQGQTPAAATAATASETPSHSESKSQ